MKVLRVTFGFRKNLGNYEHIEVSCEVLRDDDKTDAENSPDAMLEQAMYVCRKAVAGRKGATANQNASVEVS